MIHKNKIWTKEWNLLAIFFIFIIIAVLYNNIETKQHILDDIKSTDAIQRYLSGEHSLNFGFGREKLVKPILWIPLLHEYNARHWLSFGSRSSFELNQPYLYLTIKSILQQCNDSFHICIIDDTSFSKLLPEWNLALHFTSAPISTNLRYLGWMKLLYQYGGMICPPSFLCLQDLHKLYEIGTLHNTLFVGEMVNQNITSTSFLMYPNLEFCGAPKECPIVQQLCDFIQRTISTDYTAQSVFLGDFNRWCNKKIQQNKIQLLDGKYLGTKMEDDTPILIDHLMANNYLHLGKDAFGIYVPANEIINRNKYEWFARLSAKQAMQSNTILGNYLLLAGAEGMQNINGNFLDKDGEKEKLVLLNTEPVINKQVENQFVGFWNMPLGAPVWGLKPMNVGNNVMRMEYPSR